MAQTVSNQTPIQQNPGLRNYQPGISAKKVTNVEQTIILMDTVTLTQQSKESMAIYSPVHSPEEVAEKGYEMLRKLVTDLLQEQSIDHVVATGTSNIGFGALSQAEAQELVADEGYFGIEQTSDRIVDFALSLAGGDVTRLGAIKEGVERGFAEAMDAFGGTLPQISHDTFDAVMQKLDAWATETGNNKEEKNG